MKLDSRMILPLVFALLAPIVVLGAAAYGLERHRDTADERETRNAQRVMNGQVLRVGIVAAIESKLRQHEPDVIIL